MSFFSGFEQQENYFEFVQEDEIIWKKKKNLFSLTKEKKVEGKAV